MCTEENLMSRSSWKYSSRNNKKRTSGQKDEAFLSFLSTEERIPHARFIWFYYFAVFILFFFFIDQTAIWNSKIQARKEAIELKSYPVNPFVSGQISSWWSCWVSSWWVLLGRAHLSCWQRCTAALEERKALQCWSRVKCTVVKHMSESRLTITQLHRQVLQPTVNSDCSAFAGVSSSFEASMGTGVLPYPRKYAAFEFCAEKGLQILNLFKKHVLCRF